jgi:hypothetical protein
MTPNDETPSIKIGDKVQVINPESKFYKLIFTVKAMFSDMAAFHEIPEGLEVRDLELIPQETGNPSFVFYAEGEMSDEEQAEYHACMQTAMQFEELQYKVYELCKKYYVGGCTEAQLGQSIRSILTQNSKLL